MSHPGRLLIGIRKDFNFSGGGRHVSLFSFGGIWYDVSWWNNGHEDWTLICIGEDRLSSQLGNDECAIATPGHGFKTTRELSILIRRMTLAQLRRYHRMLTSVGEARCYEDVLCKLRKIGLETG